MRTDKLKKYILRAAPYLPVFWACLKVGTAYRLAAGANFGQKLVAVVPALVVAFADFAPGLNPFDWLVGIIGAALVAVAIRAKAKNAKKYRRDEEYGSARWSA